MMNTYRIAGRNISISSMYDRVHDLCADYLVPEALPDFFVQTTQADIEFEREKSAREDRREGMAVRSFSDAYLETLAVYRKIAERMPESDTILMHGSCVAVDDTGYLFTAKSGTGKSTHSRLWREMLGERTIIVNDDKPLIRITDHGALAFGTPWDGKHHLNKNISVPLKAICLLAQAEQNTIRPVSAGEAYPFLLQQVYRPMDRMALHKTLELLDRLITKVSIWKLYCNKDIEAAQIAYNAMRG